MAYSTQRATSDGTMAYLDLSIQYMKRADINVFYDGLPANPATWSWVGTTDKRIAFSPNVPNGVEVLVKRTTQINSIINVFANGAKFNNVTMDQDFTQLLYLNQEAVEGAALTDIFNDVDFHGYKIKNLGVAVDDTDAITFGQVKTIGNGAYLSAQAAAASAAAALTSQNLAADWASKLTTTVDGSSYSAKQYALNAMGSATAASGSAASASASAGTATSQASAAAGSATAADTAKTAAEAARDAAQGYRDGASGFADAAAASAADAAASAGANIGQYNGIVQAYKNAGTAGFGWYDGSLVSPGAKRWALITASGNLDLGRYDAGGVLTDIPLSINATTGVATLADGLDVNSKKITSVLDPTVAQDAATKAYVDNLLLSPNMLHNPRFLINQRKLASPTTASSAYQVRLDRWRIVVNAQTASWVSSNGGSYNTVTCPAGGWEQVLEGLDIDGGSYYVSWLGTATCQMGAVGSGTNVPNGSVVTLAAGTAIQFRWSNGTLALPSIIPGTIPRPVRWLSFAEELTRCQTYFRVVWIDAQVYGNGGSNKIWTISYPRMRSSPVNVGLQYSATPSYGGITASPPTFGIHEDAVVVTLQTSAGGPNEAYVVNYPLGLSCDL